MKRTLAAAVLVVLAVSGCGGGSKKDAVTSPTTAPTSSEPTTAATIDTTGIAAGLTAAGCADAAKALGQASQAFSPTAATDLAQATANAAAAMTALEDKVPSGAVRDAVKLLATTYGNIATATKGVNYKPGTGQVPPAEYLAAVKEFANPAFAAAGRTLGAYFGGGCK